MGQRYERQDRRESRQDHGSCPLHCRFDNGMIIIEPCRLVLLDLLCQDKRVAHQDTRQSDQAENGVEAERLIEQEQGRNHPGKTKRRCQHHHCHCRETANLQNDDDQHGSNHHRENLSECRIRLERLLDVAAHLDTISNGKRRDEWLQSFHNLLGNLRRLRRLVDIRPDRDDRRAVTTLQDRFFKPDFGVPELIQRNLTAIPAH